jgi:hypothetical protein
VEFIHPFHLDEIERALPAGSYTIETEEEALDGVSFLAWRRVATNLFVRPNQTSGAVQMWAIHPDSLEAAIKRDRPVGT